MYKILVTGSNGQLGRAVNKIFQNEKDIQIINTDVVNAEFLDITRIEDTMEFIKARKPQAIINCAAYTAVDACESDIDQAYRLNAIGPRNLSIAAKEVGAKIVHVSTDYVFCGKKEKPYTEFDEPSPVSAYGRTKLAGENFVKEFSNRYFIIRTAWLYGDGKNFIKTMLRLSETNEKVKVVADQWGSPTSAHELAKAIKHLISTENYGTFHGTCEGICTWADFAETIFKKYGKDTLVERISTDEYPTPAKRPKYSVLDNCMFRLTSGFEFKNWEQAFDDYCSGE